MKHRLTFQMKTRRAFSLVELLAVMTIITLFATLGVPALKSVTSANQLVNGANIMSGLMNQARVHAIANNTQTAIYLCEDWPGSSDKPLKAASVWAWNGDTSSWTQLSKWEQLPKGVIFQKATPATVTGTGNYYAMDNTTLANSKNITLNGQSVTVTELRFNSLGIATVPSFASGSLVQQITLRLVPGSLIAGTVQATSQEDWLDIKTDGLTGRISYNQR